jgi:hypothetical protein
MLLALFGHQHEPPFAGGHVGTRYYAMLAALEKDAAIRSIGSGEQI